MCVVSMVHDYYKDRIPESWPWRLLPEPSDRKPRGNPLGNGFPYGPPIPSKEIQDLRKLIDDFRQAVEAAKKVDALTAQPDCVDPKKATLEQRVEELERQLKRIAPIKT